MHLQDSQGIRSVPHSSSTYFKESLAKTDPANMKDFEHILISLETKYASLFSRLQEIEKQLHALK